MKQHFTKVLIAVALMTAPMFLQCELGNGIFDPSNAGIVIEPSSTVHDKDTIGIFSTKKIVLGLLLRDFIDSLRVSIPKNRFWSSSDSTFPKSALASSNLTITFSLYDTGSYTISFAAYKNNGTLATDSLKLYARSPLTQKNLFGKIGDTLVLETKSVEDPVLYVWDLQNGILIKNESPLDTYIVKTKLANGTGELYVSDRTFRSPSVLFDIVAADSNRIAVSFATAASSGPESHDSVSIRVRLSGKCDTTIAVTWQIDTAATTADTLDYLLPNPHTLSFAPGDTEKTIPVEIRNDTAIENDERIVFKITSAQAPGIVGMPSTHAYTIIDDDAPPVVSVSFSAMTSSVTEPGQAQVGIMLSAASTVPITMNFAVDSTASTADKKDYEPLVSTSVTFAPGEFFKTFTITIIDDKIVESSETLVINLISVSSFAVIGSLKTHTITISDNDFALNVNLYPANAGSIIRKVNSVVDTGPYTAGTQVEATAVAASGYTFGYFDGTQNTLDNPVTVLIDRTKSLRATFIQSGSPAPGILRELWLNITGDSVTSLTANPQYPDKPARRDIIIPYLETEYNLTDNYGQRLRAFLLPPETGNYTFWICSASQSQLWLGTGDSASTAVRIAYVPSSTGQLEWQKFASQQSGPVSLVAGRRYYIEVLHKAGTGSDHLSVAWTLPNGAEKSLIPAYHLTPYVAPNAPTITAQPQSQSVNAGSTATFSVSASGIPPLSYQWQKNSVALPGATHATYTTPVTTPADNGATFRCFVINSGGTAISSPAILTVNFLPVIMTQPQAQTVNVGQAVSFNVTAAGNPAPSYQWKKNSVAIPGATANLFTIQTPAMSDSGLYTVTVTNTVGSVLSDTARLTVTPQGSPIIITQPQSQTVNVGQPVSFSVTATGNPSPTYQWKKNGAAISGATANVFTISSPVITDTGNYSVTVTNTVGSVTSNPVHLTVNLLFAPVITAQPQAQTVNVGQAVSFIVTATGNPAPSYQWKKNNVAIPGATANLFTIQIPAMSDSGLYTVTVTNTVGSVTSDTARLTITPLGAPTILTQPQSQTVNVGQPVSFSVTAIGNPSPTYQWKKNGTAIGGATANTFTISSPAITDTGNYTVTVTNTVGSVTSNPAHLTVILLSAPVITAQPQSQTVNVGQAVSFSVTATGNPAPTYQWRKNGTVIPGATANLFTIQTPALPDSGLYTVIVTNTVGSVTSETARLTVTPQGSPTILAQPQSQTVNAGQPVSFSVTATGNPSPTFQWKKNGAAISGATSNVFTIASPVITDTGNYTVTVTNVLGSVTSNQAHLTVTLLTAPVITSQPQSQTVNAGQAVSFSVTATGNPAPSYQWRKNGTAIGGATANVYTISSPKISDTGNYTVRVTNSVGGVTSNTARLTVNPLAAPVITSQPLPQTVNVGQAVSFSVTATGNPAPTYQWRKGLLPILGATANVYTIVSPVMTDSGFYSVFVSNSVGSVISDIVRLTITPQGSPTIITQPQSQTVNEGQPVSFSVTATGNPSPTYQWSRNGSVISGATSNVFSIASPAITDTGNYTVTVTNIIGSVISNPAHLTVNLLAAPVITTQPVSQTVFVGQAVSFNVVATGNPSPSYQWHKNGIAINGATVNIYSIPLPTIDDTGNYSVTVSNFLDTVTSAPAYLTVNPLAAPVLFSPPTGAVSQPVSLTLSWNASSGATLYTVQVSTHPNFLTFIFNNSTDQTSQAISGLDNNTKHYWRVNASNAGGTSLWSPRWHFTTIIKQYTLSITAMNGSVTKSPDQALYDSGSIVTLTAVPAMGYHFTGWSGDLTSTTNPAQITMNSAKSVTANFAINTYTVTFVEGTNGTIIGTLIQSVAHGGDCSQVTANPSANHHFTGWTGDYTGTDNPLTITGVTKDMTITANFAIDTHTVTFMEGTNGTITGTLIQSVAHGGNCSQVTANPSANHHFTGWTGDYTGMDNPLTITDVTKDMAITANFAIDTHTVTFMEGTNGTITGTLIQSIAHGGDCSQVTANPSANHHFTGWTGDYTGTVNPLTITNVTNNMTITANFATDQYTVTVSSGGNGTVNPSGDQSVDYGTDLTISATPETGYHFVEWTVTGGLKLEDAVSSSTKVLSVTAPGTVTANFAPDPRLLR